MGNQAIDGVLIVEDTPIAAKAAVMIVKAVGYAPTHVITGEEAVASFSAKNFAFVLMDIGLGDGISGDEATRQIRAFEAENGQKRCPIIAVTGHVEQSKMELLEAAGIDVVIEKPLLKKQLLEILETLQPK